MNFRLKKNIFVILAIACFLVQEVYAGGIDKDSSGYSITSIKKSIVGLRKNLSLAGRTSDDLPSPVSKGLIQNFLSGLQTGGYYRGYAYSRKMTHQYGTVGAPRTLSYGDGYYDPSLFLYVGGTPTPTTSFGTELILLNPFEAYQGPGYTHAHVGPYFTMVLRGGINTKAGNFNIVAGGIEWLRLTPFTFGSNVGFNRYSIFERRPWDPVGNIKSRYASYYYSGNINQDTRWGTQAFKGFIVNGFLPKINTNVDVFYGRTQFTGGISRENVVRPSENLGIRLKKNLKNNNYYSLNTFNSFAKSDSNSFTNDIQWNIFTTEFSFNYKGILIAGELGAGRYKSPTYKENWSQGVLVDVLIPKKITRIPISLRYYDIGQSFSSNVANFNNTTIKEINLGFKGLGTPVTTPFGGNMESVGDLNNNRRGIALNTDIKVWKFVFTAGTQISAEQAKLAQDTILTYSHRVNNLVWSRLPGIFPLYNTFGPNNRVGTYYRGGYERVVTHDREADGVTPKYKRYYNALDLQAKFKSRLFNKDIYINYLGTFNSVGTSLRPITSFNDDAYVRLQYHEAEMYYQLLPDLIICLYAGLERIKANTQTDISKDTGKPRDQTGQAFGVGFDLAISNQTTLFFRQRWFSYEDKNFPGEKFNGNEATLELKIFF